MGRDMGIGAFDGEHLTCTKCNARKPISEFYKDIHTITRYAYHCAACQRIEKKESYNRTRKKPDGIFYNPETGKLIQHKGLSSKIHLNKNDERFLREHYSNTENIELAQALGLSLRTLIRRARELNLEKSKEFVSKKNRDNLMIMRAKNIKNGNSGMFKKGRPFYGNQYVKVVNDEKVRIT